jgi:hypothetical protein
MELSNRSLALLLVAAIVVSLGGTIISLNQLGSGATGLATGSGRVNLSVTSTAACKADTNVSFGTGNQPASTIILSSDSNNAGFSDCSDGAGSNICKGLQVNNTGNTDLNISFNSNANAITLLVSQTGLDVTDFIFYSRNGTFAGTNPGCRNFTANTSGNVYQSTELLLCRNLTYNDGTDILTMEFNITLEPDVSPGTKEAIITITCETV